MNEDETVNVGAVEQDKYGHSDQLCRYCDGEPAVQQQEPRDGTVKSTEEPGFCFGQKAGGHAGLVLEKDMSELRVRGGGFKNGVRSGTSFY
ncbi:hypothetical protein ACLOJK_032182 [Asimina triloba]